MRAISLLGAGLMSLATCANARPSIHASSRVFSFSDPPALEIKGLKPDMDATLRFTAKTGPVPLSAQVHVSADPRGRALLTPAQVERGLWQVAPAQGVGEDAIAAYDEAQWSSRERGWTVSVLYEGLEHARVELRQQLLQEDAKIIPVRDAGLVGALFRPAHPRKAGCLLVIGGSDGGLGWQGTMARALAQRGYCAFALAYFGMEGLPSSLSRIPIEYFSAGLDWLSRQPGVDSKRLGVVGYSKGAEAALLLGTLDSRLSFVAALVPSAYVFQAIGRGDPKSSWTKGGGEVPFIPYDSASNWAESGKPLAALYADSLRRNASAIPRATIPIERIRGSIFLAAGAADWSWPSAEMVHAMTTRLANSRSTAIHRQLVYPNAGHSLAYPDYWVPISVMPQGPTETVAGTGAARKDTWRELVRFIKANL
jgi:uncharacterized protein